MEIQIWSDVACPWCWLGKRRFDRALARFEHRDEVEIVWRSFELNPAAPAREDRPHGELLAEKFGIPRAQVAAMHARLAAEGAKEGIPYAFDRVRMENSFDAHRLTHFAGEHGRREPVTERLFAAYFANGESIGDRETLVAVAAEMGLDAAAARAMLEEGGFADAVRADEERARELGISGVPFFVLDMKYGISGAQATETILQALEQAWHERQHA